ncbi:MAG: hypothetical protein KJ949_01010 [Nanoarchaeota archaeon]|nr:hypothetical protein [Nanoarchaeota archaeon]
MKNKKAELTTQQLVTLIILIVSFAVILFLLFRLDLGKETEAELCHNSVIMRGSAVVPEDTIPLDCSRKYICITKDGSCNSMTKPEIKKVKTDSDVYKVLADEMANCWWMFGEGKVDYVGKDFFTKDNYCPICSQIAFDESLKDISAFSLGKLDQNLFYNYLTNENYTSGKTYSEYFFGTNDLDLLKQELSKNQSAEVTFGTIDFSNQYFVVTGITSEVVGKWWKYSLGGISAVVGIFIPGVGWTWTGSIVGAIFIGSGFMGSTNPEIIAIPVEGNGIKNTFMAPTIIEANSDKFESLNCQEILTTA